MNNYPFRRKEPRSSGTTITLQVVKNAFRNSRTEGTAIKNRDQTNARRKTLLILLLSWVSCDNALWLCTVEAPTLHIEEAKTLLTLRKPIAYTYS